MSDICPGTCVHLNSDKKYCKEWKRKLGYSKHKGAISFTAFFKCKECMAMDNDDLFEEIMREENAK